MTPEIRLGDSIFVQGRFDVGKQGEINVTTQRVPTSTVVEVVYPNQEGSTPEIKYLRGEDSAFKI